MCVFIHDAGVLGSDVEITACFTALWENADGGSAVDSRVNTPGGKNGGLPCASDRVR